MQWLSETLPEEWRWPGPHADLVRPKAVPDRPTRLQVLCALNAMNTGGYGVTTTGPGAYGRCGLEMEEAHLFWAMRAFVDGWLTGTSDAEEPAFVAAMKAEIARVEALSKPKPYCACGAPSCEVCHP